MGRVFLGASFLWLALFSFTFAYTSPGALVGFINDFANILSVETKGMLETTLRQFQGETSNEIAVATILTLDGETIEQFAVKLFEDWKIGGEDKDNGILLLIAPNERQVRIEVGYGLEGALTDAQSYWVIDEVMLPAFREGDYDRGVRDGVERIIAATKGEYVPGKNKNNFSWPFSLEEIITFAGFFMVWLAAILGRSKSWWAGGIVGGVIGIILGFIFGFFYAGILWLLFLIPVGLIFDYFVSKSFSNVRRTGGKHPWWTGGGGFGGGHGSGGGFGGFGGGSSGGGGASGSW